ncbi:MAG: hypothetical protein RIQ64_1555 [Actinomycetota bacterium]|jgi:predicted amidohydrolase YtcJ
MSRTVVYTARTIITMDVVRPRAEAVAVRDGRVVAIGDFSEVAAAIGADYRLDSRFESNVLVAGLIDQHLHPMLGATTLTTEVIAPEDWCLPRVIHRSADSEAEYDLRMSAANERLAPGEWLFSWGYHSLWHGKMDRARLDRLTSDRPTAVWQRSCHEWFLNSAALATIGMTRESCEGHGPASAQIDWERGHFFENGWMLVLAKFLMPVFMTADRFRTGLEQMIDYLHMNGVTAINEPGIFWRNEPWALYQELLGAPKVPFESTFLVEGRTQPLRGLSGPALIADAREQVDRGHGDKVRVVDGQVKLFADGAIISQLMQMNDPYLDENGNPDPQHHGEWLMEPDELRSVFDAYWDADWQIHIHVNGDLGLDVLLDIIEGSQRRHPRVDHRTVIVHFANSTEEQVDRIARLGAIVSANPYYPVGFADKYSQWGLGPTRADTMVRASSVLRRGIPLSFHSDLPMCPSDPLLMASFAVNRVTPSGRIAGPEQRIDVHSALRGVTIEAAHSWRREHELGSITIGKIANFTVLDADPYEVDPSRISAIGVVATVFRGETFTVDADLAARRVAFHEGSITNSGTHSTVGRNDGHDCGCDVARFLAEHTTPDGWAA